MKCHRETVRWPLWVHLVAGFGLLLFGGGSAAVILRTGERAPLAGLAAAGIAAFVWWRMRHLEVELGPGGAAFGFGGLWRRVARERIVSAQVEAYSAARYMGWGFRIGWKPRDRAYALIGHPRGVRLVFDDERGRRWSVFLSSCDPEAAVAALAP